MDYLQRKQKSHSILSGFLITASILPISVIKIGILDGDNKVYRLLFRNTADDTLPLAKK